MRTNHASGQRLVLVGVWIAVYFLSISWLFGVPYYSPVHWLLAFIFLAPSLLIVITLPKKLPGALARPKHWYACVLAIPALFVLPGWYKVGPVLLILAMATGALGRRMRILQAVPACFLLLAGIYIWQFPVEKLYDYFASRFHEVSLVDAVLFHITRVFHLPASLSDHTLFIQTMRKLEPVLITWEKLGVLPFLKLLFGAIGAFFLLRPRRPLRLLVKFSLILIGYSIVRATFTIVLFYALTFFLPYESDYNFATLFWNPFVIALTFLPLPFLLERFAPFYVYLGWGPGQVYQKASSSSWRRSPIVPLAVGIFLLIGAYGFSDPGDLKEGRVIVDTGHSEWERVDQAYDTEWYGPESGYNYYSIMQYLDHFYDVDYRDTELTSELLDEYDVLLIKIPTAPFAKKEIMAIKDFVNRGGGLYLIGDHTNIFGSGVFLNDIAEEFGFRYRYDCVFDIQKVFEELYRVPEILPHPILREMPHLRFQTSCSIEPLVPTFGGAIIGNKLKTLDIDYSSDNFYPQVEDTPLMKFGPFVQMIVRYYGKGRIVGFTDSTIFSNFAAFLPGTSELFLYTIDWLNRRNRLNWINSVLTIAGALLILSSFFRYASIKRRFWDNATHISFAFLAISLAILTFEGINKVGHKTPSPRSHPKTVLFNKAQSGFLLPIYRYEERRFANFSIFYQWVLRLGYFPHVDLYGKEIPEETNLLVFIYPNRPLTEPYLDRIKSYVENGGSLLVLDGPANSHSTANAILEPFGLRFEAQNIIDIMDFKSVGSDSLVSLFAPIHGWAVTGGEARYVCSHNPIIGATRMQGKGRVTAIGFARLFSNLFMGQDQALYPSIAQRRYYRIEFDLLRELVESRQYQ